MAAEKGLNVLLKVSGGSPTSYVAALVDAAVTKPGRRGPYKKRNSY